MARLAVWERSSHAVADFEADAIALDVGNAAIGFGLLETDYRRVDLEGCKDTDGLVAD